MIKISEYRGFTILQGSYFIVRKGKGRLNYGGGFNTAWSAKVYIDEMLSP